MVKGSYDFLGLNYYTSNYAANNPVYNNEEASYQTDCRCNLTSERNGIAIGPQAASPWLFVYPRGIKDLLLYTKQRYKNPIIYITENGIDEVDNGTLSHEEALTDTMRIDYYYHHLSNVAKAIKLGVDLRGYFAWVVQVEVE
ncbi:Beta-glucosidase [Thalictrum thalictroides]|uniref:Beta-glucosidase n=1 Tax=Thalictrum thalictroides TaxID=46969 RepID=A0A7J6X3M1_THATH|nr:Beta-glucosidase [Thalictrum thalictroides]